MSKVKKLIASLLIVASVITIHTVQANASTTGWQGNNISGWWYVDNTGNYVTGWVQIGEQWYYFDNQGWMLSNTWINGYYLSSSGAWDSTNGNRADYFKSRHVTGGTAGNDPENAQRMAEQNGYSQQSSDASQYPANDPRSRGVSGQVSTSSDGTLSQNMKRSQQSQNTNSSDPFAPMGGTAGNDSTNAQKMGNANQ